MADLIGNIEEFFQNLPELLKLQEPWWLLMATLPLALGLSQIWPGSRVADRKHRNAIVHHASVPVNRQWPRRLINALLLLAMVGLVYPAARPINSSQAVNEDALVVWVYDASESMSTIDVLRGDQTVSRFTAAVAALEESLPTIPDEHYKLLISFSGVQEVEVNVPTLDSAAILDQARSIVRGKNTATDFGLERAVSACQQFFASQDSSPCQIFLLSDGKCEPRRPHCQTRTEKIARQAAEHGIVIHTISWGNPESGFRANPEEMKLVAAAGNGQHLSSSDTEELAQLYQETAYGLKTFVIDQALNSFLAWIARGLVVILALIFWLRHLERTGRLLRRSAKSSDG